jgi:hypothetical protein
MESTQTPLRFRLVLGKVQVIAVEKGATGMKFRVDMGNSVKATIDCPIGADVQLGDWLTLFTEVLADANPFPAPLQ